MLLLPSASFTDDELHSLMARGDEISNVTGLAFRGVATGNSNIGGEKGGCIMQNELPALMAGGEEISRVAGRMVIRRDVEDLEEAGWVETVVAEGEEKAPSFLTLASPSLAVSFSIALLLPFMTALLFCPSLV